MPKGKGVWVHTVKHAKTPAQMIENLKRIGADYVLLATVWQKEDGRTVRYSPQNIPRYAEALREAGIDVWLWGWPDSSKKRIDTFVSEVVPIWEASKASGFVLDMEDQWNKRHDSNARYLITQLRKHGPVGVTTYGGGPANVPNFPWKAIAQESDFGMPQIYTELSKYGEGYPERAVTRYVDAGFRGVVPVLSAAPKRNRAYMDAYQAHTPLPEDSVSYWHYHHLFRGGNAAASRALALASYDVGDYGSALA